jgi:hypothetical protein
MLVVESINSCKTSSFLLIEPKIVFSVKFGTRYTPDGFKSIWQRAQAKALKEGHIKERFKFHHLKAKGVSDHEGDKRKFSGHATWAMVDDYDRKPDEVDSLDIDLRYEKEDVEEY